VRLPILAAAALAASLVGGTCSASRYDVAQLLEMAPDPADYPNDAQARVVDFAEYTLHDDGTVTEHVHTVMMVLNERGREAGESVMYTEGDEEVTVLCARTIKKTGEVVEVPSSDIFVTSVFAGYDLYENIKQLRFTYPAIEDEALLEFEYERRILRPLLPDYVSFGWSMQGSEPQMGSELIIHAPSDRKLILDRFNGAPQPKWMPSDDGSSVTWHWRSRAYPAVESEPYMPGEQTIVPWLSIAVKYRWDDVAGVLAGGVEGKAAPDDTIRGAVAEICQGAVDDEDKVRRIYYWIQNNMRDVGASPLLTRFDVRSAEEVYRKRYGNCQALAGLMIAMLDAAGIQGRWAFVDSAAQPGTLKDVNAEFELIEDCLCYVKIGDKEYWIDPTAECTPLGELSPAYEGCAALVLKDGGYDFLDTPKRDDERPDTIAFTDVALSPNGDARVRVSGRYLHDDAVGRRVGYKYAKPDKIEESFRSAVQSNCASGKLVDYIYPDWRDFESPVRSSYTFDAPGWAQSAGGYLIVRPNPSQSSSEGRDPFPEKERKYDLEFGPRPPDRRIFTLTIPEGYEVHSLPEDFVRSTKFVDVAIRYVAKGDWVLVGRDIEWKAASLPKSRLPEVRQFFVDLGKRGRDAIVLQRK
jgi:hypothetical protein